MFTVFYFETMAVADDDGMRVAVFELNDTSYYYLLANDVNVDDGHSMLVLDASLLTDVGVGMA